MGNKILQLTKFRSGDLETKSINSASTVTETSEEPKVGTAFSLSINNNYFELGGLDLFRFSDFVIGLKVSLINKILNSNFNHPWKNIVINQLKFPDYMVISIENSLTINKCGFMYDLLNCYREWKNKSAEASGGTVDHCIWNNSFITDIGSKFWNALLISKNIMYLSQFVNENGEVMSYEQFITK